MKKIEIRFRKIFEYEFEGLESNAIISWEKIPWWTDGKQTTLYRYYLKIDLWLFKLRFNWVKTVNLLSEAKK